MNNNKKGYSIIASVIFFVLFAYWMYLTPEYKSSESEIVDSQCFQMSLPEGWKAEEAPGIDSEIYMITGDGIHMFSDCGWYSNSLDMDGEIVIAESPAFELRHIQIDGHQAKMVFPIGPGVMGVHFPDIGEKTGLTIATQTPQLNQEQKDKILAMFSTIDIK